MSICLVSSCSRHCLIEIRFDGRVIDVKCMYSVGSGLTLYRSFNHLGCTWNQNSWIASFCFQTATLHRRMNTNDHFSDVRFVEFSSIDVRESQVVRLSAPPRNGKKDDLMVRSFDPGLMCNHPSRKGTLEAERIHFPARWVASWHWWTMFWPTESNRPCPIGYHWRGRYTSLVLSMLQYACWLACTKHEWRDSLKRVFMLLGFG